MSIIRKKVSNMLVVAIVFQTLGTIFRMLLKWEIILVQVTETITFNLISLNFNTPAEIDKGRWRDWLGSLGTRINFQRQKYQIQRK